MTFPFHKVVNRKTFPELGVGIVYRTHSVGGKWKRGDGGAGTPNDNLQNHVLTFHSPGVHIIASVTFSPELPLVMGAGKKSNLIAVIDIPSKPTNEVVKSSDRDKFCARLNSSCARKLNAKRTACWIFIVCIFFMHSFILSKDNQIDSHTIRLVTE